MKYLKIYEIYANENLDYLLSELGEISQIGDEIKIPLGGNFYLYKSEFGSYRFIKKIGSEIVSTIQVMYRNGNIPYATNAFTKLEFRKQGIALDIMKKAEIYFGEKLDTSNDTSDLGFKLKNSYNRINEGKNVGILYHYTDDESILSILETNTLKANHNDYDSPNSVSFTRNKNFHSNKYRTMDDSFRLVIDGDKLSNNYKVKPYQDAYEPMIQDYLWKGHPNRRLYYESESEEKVESDINNILKYIIEINYSTKYYKNSLRVESTKEIFQEISQLCIENNIKLIKM